MTEVAAAIISDAQGRILVCQRGDGGSCAGLWEFPGGKREAGESMEECLVRECREELDVEIAVNYLFDTAVYEYPERRISFSFFRARIVSGYPRLTVHMGMIWMPPECLDRIEFCPADTDIVKRLKREKLHGPLFS